MQVSALAAALEGWLKGQRTRDLAGLLRPIEGKESYKTAPVASILASFASLALVLVVVARNTIVHGAKLGRALLGMHESRPCLFAVVGPELEAKRIQLVLWVLLSKYRQLKEDASQRRITLGKATSSSPARSPSTLSSPSSSHPLAPSPHYQQ